MEGTAASTPNEFLNLCYLLTCKSVGDARHFGSWAGVLGGREKLADELGRYSTTVTVAGRHVLCGIIAEMRNGVRRVNVFRFVAVRGVKGGTLLRSYGGARSKQYSRVLL